MKQELQIWSTISIDDLEEAIDALSEKLSPKQAMVFAKRMIDTIIYRVSQVSDEEDMKTLTKYIAKFCKNYHD